MTRALLGIILIASLACSVAAPAGRAERPFNGWYAGEHLSRGGFPLGGFGAGMIALDSTGSISQVSVRNRIQFFNEPLLFAAVGIEGRPDAAKVLEGPVPAWKTFGLPGTGNGRGGTNWGLPRFAEARFLARFPFGILELEDADNPLQVTVTGWSPFTPGDAAASSLPAAALEYAFENTTAAEVRAVFSCHAQNFMETGKEGQVLPLPGGFVLWQKAEAEHPESQGGFAVRLDGDGVRVDHCWFQGGWFDALSILWRTIREARTIDNPPVAGRSRGASLYAPFTVPAGGTRTLRLQLSWHVPQSTLRVGARPEQKTDRKPEQNAEQGCCESLTYQPWYAGRFATIQDVAEHWRAAYDDLRARSDLFRLAFYETTLPPEVVEAAAANLTILKSPTVLRQTDGRMWAFEGCGDEAGCCHGSCTHVWNYAQAIPHLFPSLERTLRETEFFICQNEAGHQTFRCPLPIGEPTHDFHAAADGQLGGIMKVYREWRISGDDAWLLKLWPKVAQSLDYCIRTWDPRGRGVLEEPHHNTYDIEYWGPDGHCTSVYLGALEAAARMSERLGQDAGRYRRLIAAGRKALESRLWNGEYFIQVVQTEGLNASFQGIDYSANGPGYEAIIETLNAEGPKYQYGTGCLSDGVFGFWLARACGLDEQADPAKIRSHLQAVHRYNLRIDLMDHANPQRPAFALGGDGGLLLCTWPRGGELLLPFVYSNEVWTGIEYQVAAHAIMHGLVEEGLEIVRTARLRYDGRNRNPFNEYECGHWYARALSSYSLLQALTGVRYDAVEKTLYIDSRVGDSFRSYLSTATGFGTVGLDKGRPVVEVRSGTIPVDRVMVSGKEVAPRAEKSQQP